MIFQVPSRRGSRQGQTPLQAWTRVPKRYPSAEAVLEADRIQDLADQMPELLKAAIGNDLKFTVRIEVGGESAPAPATLEKINELLADVSEELRLE